MRAPLVLIMSLSLIAVACGMPTTTVTSTETVVSRQSRDGQSPKPARRTALVTRVVDGDTAHVSYRGRDVTIRFIGVDTPETVAPGQPIECYGPQSSRFTTDELTGERIRLEFDVERIDPYGRTLAYLWMPDGSMFNATLVQRLVPGDRPGAHNPDQGVARQRVGHWRHHPDRQAPPPRRGHLAPPPVG